MASIAYGLSVRAAIIMEANKRASYILEDDQRTVDATDGVVADSRHNGVRRRLARVRHGEVARQGDVAG